MNTEQYQEDIQNYLNGRLSPEEQTRLEMRIMNTQKLATEVNRFRTLRILQRQAHLIQGKALLEEIIADTPVVPEYGKHGSIFREHVLNTRRIRYFSATVVLAFIAVLVFFIRQKQYENNLKSISRFHLQPIGNMIGFAPDDQSNAALAMHAYDAKDYAQTVSRLEKELENNADDNSLQLYLGVSCLMLQQPDRAIKLLRPVAATEHFVTTPAKWYLALAYLQTGETEQAQKLLRGLTSDTVYGAHATALLEKISL